MGKTIALSYGHLAHLGKDRWKVWVYAGIDPRTRKQRMRTKTFRADTEAAAKREGAKHAGRLVDAISEQRAERGTVAELAREFLDDRKGGWSPTTYQRAAQIVAVIVKDLGRVRLEQLTARQVDAWYGTLRKRGLTDANIHHYHRILRSMLNRAEEWDMVEKVATKKARPPAVPRYQSKMPATATVQAVLESSRGDMRTAFYVLAATGMRRGEIIGLRWGDIVDRKLTVSRAVVHVDGKLIPKSTKSGQTRAVTLDDATLSELAAHATRSATKAAQLGGTVTADSYVFADYRADPNGRTPRRPGWLTHAWTQQRARHGSKARLHDLRHWHASALLDSGRPMPEVSARLGHADPSITARIYAHAVEGADSASADVMGELLPAKNG